MAAAGIAGRTAPSQQAAQIGGRFEIGRFEPALAGAGHAADQHVESVPRASAAPSSSSLKAAGKFFARQLAHALGDERSTARCRRRHRCPRRAGWTCPNRRRSSPRVGHELPLGCLPGSAATLIAAAPFQPDRFWRSQPGEPSSGPSAVSSPALVSRAICRFATVFGASHKYDFLCGTAFTPWPGHVRTSATRDALRAPALQRGKRT